MIYVMSDIHGYYDKYRMMLERIEFDGGDTLYILGDAVDRGPEGIRILLDIAERSNVRFIEGNHDNIARKILGCLTDDSSDFREAALEEAIRAWMADGGEPTLRAFLNLPRQGRNQVLRVLSSALIFDEVQLGARCFFLSHTIPEAEVMRDPTRWKLHDFLWGKPDYDEMYFPDKILVTGHTPTGLIDPAFEGRICYRNNHLAVDCGAGFGNPLGCICLDTMEEFYV